MAEDGGGMGTGDLFQGQTAPVRVSFTLPDDLGTADAPKLCRGSDGCDYVVKDKSIHAAIPHSEWFCSQLGEQVGIPAPVHKIMDLGGGVMAFGSRWHGGALSPDGVVPWYERVSTGELSLTDVSSALSRIYAFDQFIHNEDRHTGNLLVVPQYLGHAVLAFDYSQAWLCFGFPLSPPPLPRCQTVDVQRRLAVIWNGCYVDASIVKETCNAIASLPLVNIQQIMASHPNDWLPEGDRQAIASWWGSDDMTLRLNQIVEGVENGSCL